MSLVRIRVKRSRTLGAHAHAHGFWVGMGAILLFMGGHGCDVIGNVTQASIVG